MTMTMKMNGSRKGLDHLLPRSVKGMDENEVVSLFMKLPLVLLQKA